MDPFVLFSERIFIGTMGASNTTIDCSTHLPSNATLVLVSGQIANARPFEGSVYVGLRSNSVGFVPLGASKKIVFQYDGGWVSGSGQLYILGYATDSTYTPITPNEFYRGKENVYPTWKTNWHTIKLYPDLYGIPPNATAVHVSASSTSFQRQYRIRFPGSYEFTPIGESLRTPEAAFNIVVPVKGNIAEFHIRGYDTPESVPGTAENVAYVVGYFTAGDFDLDDYSGNEPLTLDDLQDNFNRVGPILDTAHTLCSFNFYNKPTGDDAFSHEKKDGDTTTRDSDWGFIDLTFHLSYVPVDQTGYSRYGGNHTVFKRYGSVNRNFLGRSKMATEVSCSMGMHRISLLGAARPTADYSASITVKSIFDDSSYTAVGLVIRYVDADNYYFGLYHVLLKLWMIGRVSSGVYSTIASGYDAISGDNFKMTFQAAGTNLSLRYNDNTVLAAVDSSVAGPGKAGIVGVK